MIIAIGLKLRLDRLIQSPMRFQASDGHFSFHKNSIKKRKKIGVRVKCLSDKKDSEVNVYLAQSVAVV